MGMCIGVGGYVVVTGILWGQVASSAALIGSPKGPLSDVIGKRLEIEEDLIVLIPRVKSGYAEKTSGDKS